MLIQSHPIRSYVRREGRLTLGQQRAMTELYPRYGVGESSQVINAESLFGRTAALTLEIGFGNGDSLLQLAISDPNNDYLGVDVHRPGVGRLLLNIEQTDIENLRLAHGDAVELLAQRIGNQCLDRVLILFPDPWHKKRHHKRRLVQSSFVSLLATRIKPGGQLQVATDWQDYAEHIQQVMATSDDFELKLVQSNQPYQRPLTKYEQRGQRLKHTIIDMVFTRRRG